MFYKALDVNLALDNDHDVLIHIEVFMKQTKWTISDFEFLLAKIVATKKKFPASSYKATDLIDFFDCHNRPHLFTG
jgi:hypothetical protein